MKKLTVMLNKNYDIYIGSGILSNCGEYIKQVANGNKIFVISDNNVAKFYYNDIKSSLIQAGFDVSCYFFKPGETNKNFDVVYKIVCAMSDFKLSRCDTVAALGGGIVGDMAGFAASIYMRGIDFVQLSTSLLSDVDSSVGGKTGCNLDNGKNLIGAFHQPSLVLIDTDTLKTLDNRFIIDGMAEVIKYGAIRSKSLFDKLNKKDFMNQIEEIIFECIDIKRQIVQADEFEQGERKLLNFGHTIGHAVEKYYNYQKYTHGEAVSIGMAAISKASEKNGISEIGLADEIIKLLESFGLPTKCDADIKDLIKICLSDKKIKNDTIDLVIALKIGESQILNIKTDELLDFFADI